MRAAGRDDKVKRERSRAVSIAALGLLVGCSPSQFVLREHQARRALERAEHTEARTLARYELTQSRLFLAKAREAAGEAHYRRALELAERSTESSRRASTLALARGVSAE
ncbi:MAG TPA: hypothetical protein VFX59_08795 [Polyangiales bacterium]|nr:hypothetical protein [Polyangiales bacterium]